MHAERTLEARHWEQIKALARTLRGRLRAADGRFAVEWSCEGGAARIELSAAGVAARFAVSPIRARMRLVREGWVGRLRRYFGAQDLVLGHAEFDRLFLIQGVPEDEVRRALSPRVRAALLALLQRTPKAAGDIAVEVGGIGVLIVCRCKPGSLDVHRFADLALEVYRGLRTPVPVEAAPEKPAPAPAPPVVRSAEEVASRTAPTPAVEIVPSGRCPVCDCPLAPPLNTCARCRTPHHADCWGYFGGCAIFACGGSRDLAEAKARNSRRRKRKPRSRRHELES